MELQTVVKMFQTYHNKHFPNNKSFIKDQHFLNADFEWACDECLSAGKAVVAIPNKQETSGYPNLAYSDTSYSCFTCKAEFIFKKEEKQLWYEQLKFPTSSAPNDCTDCRKIIRKRKVENKQLSALLKRKEDTLNTDELQQVIAIYKQWDKPERVAYFKSLLKKKTT